MLTGQTSCPSRCSGKVAAELPTWPYATDDWMDRIRMTGSVNALRAAVGVTTDLPRQVQPDRGWEAVGVVPCP